MKKYLKKRKNLKRIYQKELAKQKELMKQAQLKKKIAEVKAKAKQKAKQKHGRTTRQKADQTITSFKKGGARIVKGAKKGAKAWEKSPTRKVGKNWADNVMKGIE